MSHDCWWTGYIYHLNQKIMATAKKGAKKAAPKKKAASKKKPIKLGGIPTKGGGG